jgi:transcriptional regulator with XRE-family HTH domain
MKEKHLTTTQVAQEFGVDMRTVSRWIREGQLPNAFKAYEGLRAPYLIPLSDVLALQATKQGKNTMTITAEMTKNEVVELMLAAGAPAVVGETYITDWVEEGDPVGMTVESLVAEWIE